MAVLHLKTEILKKNGTKIIFGEYFGPRGHVALLGVFELCNLISLWGVFELRDLISLLGVLGQCDQMCIKRVVYSTLLDPAKTLHSNVVHYTHV